MFDPLPRSAPKKLSLNILVQWLLNTRIDHFYLSRPELCGNKCNRRQKCTALSKATYHLSEHCCNHISWTTPGQMFLNSDSLVRDVDTKGKCTPHPIPPPLDAFWHPKQWTFGIYVVAIENFGKMSWMSYFHIWCQPENILYLRLAADISDNHLPFLHPPLLIPTTYYCTISRVTIVTVQSDKKKKNTGV